MNEMHSNQTPGEMLRKAREMQGFSPEDMHKRLRLKLSLIQDIENDRYQNISASVYMRGYLRAYARALGINEDHIMSAFAALEIPDSMKSYEEYRVSPPAPSEEVVENHHFWLRWPLLGLLGCLIIAALMVWWNQSKTPVKTAVIPAKIVPAANNTVVLPPNPDTVAVAPVPETPLVENPAPLAPVEKKHQSPIKRSHRMAHHELKPNYTLSPVSKNGFN